MCSFSFGSLFVFNIELEFGRTVKLGLDSMKNKKKYVCAKIEQKIKSDLSQFCWRNLQVNVCPELIQ